MFVAGCCVLVTGCWIEGVERKTDAIMIKVTDNVTTALRDIQSMECEAYGTAVVEIAVFPSG